MAFRLFLCNFVSAFEKRKNKRGVNTNDYEQRF